MVKSAGKKVPRWLEVERRRLDRINLQISTLVQERTSIARRIAERKVRTGLEVKDPGREDAMVEAILARGGVGLSPKRLERLFRALFAATRAQIGQDLKRKGQSQLPSVPDRLISAKGRRDAGSRSSGAATQRNRR